MEIGKVAEVFGKRHKHVLDTIEALKAENSALTHMFYKTSYKAGTGKSYPMYLMNRDGFSLLVMGFTGKRALEWKGLHVALCSLYHIATSAPLIPLATFPLVN